MNQPIHDNQINKILLQPRFKIEVKEEVDEVIEKLKDNLEKDSCKFKNKIIDHHIVIDIPFQEEHYWSPQMHIEVEKNEENNTIVKGVLGPKPKVWTFFMFLHFIVAIAFFIFLVIFYTKWSLNQDFILPMVLCIFMPVVWIILYFIGQLGKKLGYKQMAELHDFLVNSISN